MEGSVSNVLDRRLLPDSPRPIAVALSGGGDSLALTLMADRWAKAAGRSLLILTVDHRLQAAGADWTRTCAGVAGRLGHPFVSLSWDGEKPTTGLPASARQARHRLIAEAARQAGARVILMGHTADDVLEARRMREAGATTPEPRAWAPSPVWPEGRGLMLLRPLLGARRAELRAWLSARGESWIEDPANADLRYARPRARLAMGPDDAPVSEERSPPALAQDWVHAIGILRLDRPSLRAVSAGEAGRLVARACVCAGGGERHPAAPRIARIVEGLRGTAPFVATLAGARVDAWQSTIRIAREPGEARRGGLAPLSLPVGREVIWDGRFAVMSDRPGLEMRPVAGVAARLSALERRRLVAMAPSERGGLPVVIDADGKVAGPMLSDDTGVTVTSLVGDRLAAAMGLVDREAA